MREGETGEPVVLRIEDLSAATGVSVRNIREYQSRGLLDPPERLGRSVRYNEQHVLRLRLITRMLGRGYTMANVRDLLDVWAGGRELDDLLGLEEAARRDGDDGERVTLSRAQLDEIFGNPLDDADVEHLVSTGVIQVVEGGYDCSRAKLVETVRLLVAGGIPVRDSLGTLLRIREHLDAIAQEMVRVAFGALVPDGTASEELDVGQLTGALDRLRPAAEVMTSGVFGLALNRAVDEAVSRAAGRALGHDRPHP